MRRLRDAVFFLGMGTLFTHELDAVPNHEWRGLPFLQAMPDELAMPVFVIAHVPLFAVLIALVASADARIRTLSRIGIAGFLLVHGLLHGLSMGQETYEFSSPLSNVLIFGAAGLGAIYLALAAHDRSARESRSSAD